MNGIYEVEHAETIAERERRLSFGGYCESTGLDFGRSFYSWAVIPPLPPGVEIESGYTDGEGNWWIYSKEGIVRQ